MSIANARLYHWFSSTSVRIDGVVTKNQGSAKHSQSPRNLLKGNAPDMPNYVKGAILYSSLPSIAAHLNGQGTNTPDISPIQVLDHHIAQVDPGDIR